MHVQQRVVWAKNAPSKQFQFCLGAVPRVSQKLNAVQYALHVRLRLREHVQMRDEY